MQTIVIFRKFAGGDILALFPYEKQANNFCLSYMHTGQHGPAHYLSMIMNSRPAKPEEYNDLFQELQSIGYDLKVMQKASYRKMYGK